ncbi:hypothetical protein L596_021419 [Steinernema carpocapsae]|uniref:Uncharacterized protein n=1 Tax=Steinernema carpocapsae TaxID=34508 RepID=A0A4U5MIN0_STECR|nr:hypothetical protein L596_021419 [Steinernema carpocapsae]
MPRPQTRNVAAAEAKTAVSLNSALSQEIKTNRKTTVFVWYQLSTIKDWPSFIAVRKLIKDFTSLFQIPTEGNC